MILPVKSLLHELKTQCQSQRHYILYSTMINSLETIHTMRQILLRSTCMLGIDILFLPILFYYSSKFYLLFSLTLPIIFNKNVYIIFTKLNDNCTATLLTKKHRNTFVGMKMDFLTKKKPSLLLQTDG